MEPDFPRSITDDGCASVQLSFDSITYQDESKMTSGTGNHPVKKDRNIELDSEETLAPDGGWGWLVLIGASLILFIVDTMGQCFGIHFSTFLLNLKIPAVTITWIFNSYLFMCYIPGPFLNPLIAHFGWRILSMACSFLVAIGTLTTAFASSAGLLFFTYSFLIGFSCGILSAISYLIVPLYFNKRRGLANGILMSWDCSGQFIGSHLVYFLLDRYAFKGGMLIFGGVVLNCCIGAMLFHPISWHMKVKTKTTIQIEKHQEQENQNSLPDVIEIPSKINGQVNFLKSVATDLSNLKSAKAVIIVIQYVAIHITCLNYLALAPFFMQEVGHSLADTATCFSISALCSILSRLFVAWFSDSKVFSFRAAMMISALGISGGTLGFTLTDSLLWLRVTMGIYGCGVGIFNAISTLTMIHYIGIDYFIPIFGLCRFVTSFGYISVGPLAGYMYDVTESYAGCIWLLAGVSMVSFFLWILMPLAEAFDIRRSCKKERETAEEK